MRTPVRALAIAVLASSTLSVVPTAHAVLPGGSTASTTNSSTSTATSTDTSTSTAASAAPPSARTRARLVIPAPERTVIGDHSRRWPSMGYGDAR